MTRVRMSDYKSVLCFSGVQQCRITRGQPPIRASCSVTVTTSPQWWTPTGCSHGWWQYHSWSLTFASRKNVMSSTFWKAQSMHRIYFFCEAVSKLCHWPLCIISWHEIPCACWEAAGESEEERVHRPHAGWGSQVINKTWEKILCFLLQPLSCTCCCETHAGWTLPPPFNMHLCIKPCT